MRTLFLHGNVGTAADWEPVLSDPALGKLNAFAPNLWEYFREPRPHSFGDWAEWFCAGLIEGQETALVGYSLGGRLAMHALLARPDKFSGAVIISANPGLADSDQRSSRLSADCEWASMAASDWNEFLAQWERQPVFDGSASLPDRNELREWKTEIGASFDAWSLGRQESLLPCLKRIQCPVLWVSGDRDERFSKLAEKAAGVSTGLRATVDGAGHRVPMDRPIELAVLVRDFLAALA